MPIFNPNNPDGAGGTSDTGNPGNPYDGYNLDARQRRLYKRCTVRLLSQPQTATDPTTHRVLDMGTPTVIATNVPCLYVATINFGEPNPQGRRKQYDELSSDKFEFPIEVALEDVYLIQITLTSHRQYGQIWQASGDALVVDHSPVSYQSVLALTITPPDGMPAL